MGNRKWTMGFISAFALCCVLLLAVFLTGSAHAATCAGAESLVKVTKNAGGTVTESDVDFTSQCVTKGEAISLTIAPDEGYKIKSVKINGATQLISFPEDAEVMDVTASTKKKTTVAVVFELRTFNVSVSSDDTDITISPKPATGEIKKKFNQKITFVLRSKDPDKTPELVVDGEVVELTQNGKKYTYQLTVKGDHDVFAQAAEQVPQQISNAFPTSFALSSPLKPKKSQAKAVIHKAEGEVAEPEVGSVEEEIEAINEILTAADEAGCVFDPHLFRVHAPDVKCYGPAVDYEKHPDASIVSPNFQSPESGTLPPGDLGIWTVNETLLPLPGQESGLTTACSAAKLNSLVDGTSAKVNGSLKVLAAMLCIAKVNEIEMPADGETVDLTAEMNGLAGTLGVDSLISFNNATVAYSGGDSEEYDYSLDVTLTFDAISTDLAINLVHMPGASEDDYKGRLNYRMNGVDNQGNCNAIFGSPNVTFAGSVLYQKDSATELSADARSAQYCGSDVAPFAESGENVGLLDPSVKSDPQNLNPKGWVGDFNYFVANTDPSSRAGNYAFAWQAGAHDNNTRTFNVTLSKDNDTGKLTGAAFFGFGDDIENADPGIKGFICNWAGPGNQHDYKDLVQAQYLTEDANGLFTASESYVTYAPTNSCEYAGDSAFLYDKDADDDLADESSSAAVTSDLKELADADADEVFDIFETKGFSMPVPPTNF